MIERHLPQYFKGGTAEKIAKTTFWPTGTTPSNLLRYLDEAITKLDTKLLAPYHYEDVILSNGITARVYSAAGKIFNMHPISGPGVFKGADVIKAL